MSATSRADVVVRRCTHLALNDQGFVFDPTTGDSYVVNPVGLLILEQLRAGESDRAVVAVIEERFGVAPEEARRAADDFIGRLKSFGLEAGAA